MFRIMFPFHWALMRQLQRELKRRETMLNLLVHKPSDPVAKNYVNQQRIALSRANAELNKSLKISKK